MEALLAGREKVNLDEAMDELADSELITGVFSSTTSSAITTRRLKVNRDAAMFFGALAGMVLGLGFIAGSKAMKPTGASNADDASMVRLKLWMPEGTRARIGPQNINMPGHIDAVPGPNQLELYFDNRRTLSCPFDAAGAQAVRYVGGDGISINDGPTVACTVIEEGAGPR